MATPLLSGLLVVIMLATLMQCYSTCLAPVNSLPNDQPKIFIAVMIEVLVSVEVAMTSLHTMNHLMVKAGAGHGRINLVTRFHY